MQPILLRPHGSVLADTSGCTSQSQIHCRDIASTSRGGGGGRKGSGKLEGHKGEWGGQPEKWGENQVTPFSATFPVPLWEIEPSLFVVGFSFFKGLHQRPLNSKLARVRGCVSACVRHCHRSGQDAEWPLEQKPLLTRYIVIVF